VSVNGIPVATTNGIGMVPLPRAQEPLTGGTPRVRRPCGPRRTAARSATARRAPPRHGALHHGTARSSPGTRLSVEFILELLANGATGGEILSAYPQVPPEGLPAALRYAAKAMRNEVAWEIPPSA
jgi:uncharacterized protein (DUF433 family)